MQQYLQNKKGLVENVFDQVYDRYDLMNDFMSLGIHRIWKKNLLNMMNPTQNHRLVDVACGTGDIAKLYLKYVNKDSQITCIDPNKGMIKKGKVKLNKFKNLNWVIAPAEKLPFEDNSHDVIVLSHGLEYTHNPYLLMREIDRIATDNATIVLIGFNKFSLWSLIKVISSKPPII